MTQPLPRAEPLDIRSVLERSKQRADRRAADAAATVMDEHHAEMLAREVAKINEELSR